MHPLEKRLNYTFKDKNLLRLALTHKSATMDDINCYERLEFLGDAVLELVVSKFLYENYNFSEGKLTHIRATVVCKETLSRISQEIGLKNYIILGKNEKKDELENNKSIQADVLEAIFGAMFIDSDLSVVSQIILSFLKPFIEKAIQGKLFYDYKTKLQEFVQKKNVGKVEYIDLGNLSLDEYKFKVDLCLNNEKIAEGCGHTKKEAEQKAAQEALKKLGVEDIEI